MQISLNCHKPSVIVSTSSKTLFRGNAENTPAQPKQLPADTFTKTTEPKAAEVKPSTDAKAPAEAKTDAKTAEVKPDVKAEVKSGEVKPEKKCEGKDCK